MPIWAEGSSRSALVWLDVASAGGARTLIATNKGTRWFFLFGFEKNERANIDADEKDALQSLASDLLARSGKELDIAVGDGSLTEICNGTKDQDPKPHPRGGS